MCSDLKILCVHLFITGNHTLSCGHASVDMIVCVLVIRRDAAVYTFSCKVASVQFIQLLYSQYLQSYNYCY